MNGNSLLDEWEVVWTDPLRCEFVGERAYNADGLTLSFSSFYEKGETQDVKITGNLVVLARMLLELAARQGELDDEEQIQRIKSLLDG